VLKVAGDVKYQIETFGDVAFSYPNWKTSSSRLQTHKSGLRNSGYCAVGCDSIQIPVCGKALK
jgi:hypothetical protein